MNSKRKFHNPDGPAFNKGERWIHSSSHRYVEIIETRRYGNNKWDVDVTYCLVSDPGQFWQKDAWNFQVGYMHQADLGI